MSDSVAALGRSGVLGKARIETVRGRVRDGALPAGIDELTARLVEEGWLTRFQGRMIRSGRAGALALGRYVLLRPLGRGSMGRVYKAYHRMMRRPVALKLIAARDPSPRAVARFRTEMRLVGRLDHPNIVRAFDAGRSRGYFYIAMEYLKGRTLADLIRSRGTIPPEEAIRLAAETARGLAHAHARGVVHRDVKPANLLLSEQGPVKVLDLGLGVLVEEGDRIAAGQGDRLIGTAEYMSPEQARGGPVDGRSDLYSLGCTLYHLIRGEPPFADRSWVERLAIRISGEHEPIEADLPDHPPGLRRVVGRLTAPRPEDRYPTGDAATEALLALLATADGPPASAWRGVRRAGFAVAATVLFLSAALLPVPSVRRAPPPPPASAPGSPRTGLAVAVTGPAEQAAPDHPGPDDVSATSRPWPALAALSIARANWPRALSIARQKKAKASAPAVAARPVPPGGPLPGIESVTSLPPVDDRVGLASSEEPTPPLPRPSARNVAVDPRRWGYAVARPAHPVGTPTASPSPPPSPSPSSRSATIEVLLPAADAELAVQSPAGGGVRVGGVEAGDHSRRVIRTTPLDRGTAYTIAASWPVRTGHPPRRTKLQVEPGGSYRVDLRGTKPTTIGLPAWPRPAQPRARIQP